MTEPLLVVEGLNGFYGTAHVLQGVSFAMGVEPVAMIGRNGMGKTTLCTAIMGLLGAGATGSVLLDGVELLGSPPYRIAAAGVGYVPQGRRLFASLTVDEHLRDRRRAERGGAGRPTRVYELFPRLAERKNVSAARAVRRRAADARDRPRAADQPAAADHGRALRGARADDRRGADPDDQATSRPRGWGCSWSSRTSASRRRWPSASW